MVVCLVSHTANSGGAERSLLDLVEALAGRGVDCRVISPEHGDLTDQLDARGVPYAVSYFRPWCWAAGMPWWERVLKRPVAHVLHAVRLARVIRGWSCDVVLTNTLTVCEGAIAARLLGIPHITYVKEFGDAGYGLRFELGVRLSMRVLSMLSARIAFVSRALAAHFEKEVPSARSRIVYNAVLVPAVLTRDRPERLDTDAPLRCVLVSSILSAKGQTDAVLAAHELRLRGIDVALTIVGGGSKQEMTRLETLVSTLGLSERVRIAGHVPDPSPYFVESDVALMCSRREAFGRVTVEAMKLGCPVIGARGGGTPELVREGFNGLLYTPADWVDLADKIQFFHANRRRAREMGARARDWATRTFTIERYADDMLAVLHEAARNQPAPGAP